MDIKKLIKEIFNSSCIYFTLITAAYMLCMEFITTGENAAAVEAMRVLLFFLFSVLFAIANGLRKIKAIPLPLRALIHFVICVFAFYTCFLLPVRMLPSATITGIMIFTAVYWIAIGVTAFFKSRLRANREG